MNKRFALIPCRLIEIECVLFELAVKGHKPLLVLTVFAAFIASVRTEVKQVPNVCCPKPWSCFDQIEHMLVIYTLIAFGVVALFRVGRLIPWVGVSAVFRKADSAVGVFFVIFIKELVVLRKLAQIPAKVEIIAVDIRDLKYRTFYFKHEYIRHRCLTGWVKAVAKLVQRAVIIQKLIIYGACSGYLV